nr:hypothetical protein [Interfilum sp. SAG 36.88]
MTEEQKNKQKLKIVQLLEVLTQNTKELEHMARYRFEFMDELLAYALRIGPDVNQLLFSFFTKNRNLTKSNSEIARLNHNATHLYYEIVKEIFYDVGGQKKGFHSLIEDVKQQVYEMKQLQQEWQLRILTDFEKRKSPGLYTYDQLVTYDEIVPYEELFTYEQYIKELQKRNIPPSLKYIDEQNQAYLKQFRSLFFDLRELYSIARIIGKESEQLDFDTRKSWSTMNPFDIHMFLTELDVLLFSKEGNLNRDGFYEILNQRPSYVNEDRFNVDSYLMDGLSNNRVDKTIVSMNVRVALTNRSFYKLIYDDLVIYDNLTGLENFLQDRILDKNEDYLYIRNKLKKK